MADDLVAHHLPAGMATAAVVTLLGQPDETYDKGWLEQRRYTNEQIYSYYIGGWSLHGLDDAFVSIEFDAAGLLVRSEVLGY